MVNVLQSLPAIAFANEAAQNNGGGSFIAQVYHEAVYLIVLMLFLDVAIFFQTVVRQVSSQTAESATTRGYDLALAKRLAAEAIRHSIVLVLVSSTLLLGFFRISGVTVQAISIVGGALLFPIGWQMTRTLQEMSSEINHQMVAIIPLAFPWIVGGGAISYIIKQEEVAISQHNWQGLGALALAIAIALFQAWVGMRFAHLIVRWIPESWQTALNAIVGIVIMALAVQIVLGAVLTIIEAAKLT